MSDAAPIDPFDFTFWRSSTTPLVRVVEFLPPTEFIITAASGKSVRLSWKGDVVTVSGDLPVTDAARTLLDAIGIEAINRQACKPEPSK